jgi:tetratricopeptide (TPR) repeat protein
MSAMRLWVVAMAMAAGGLGCALPARAADAGAAAVHAERAYQEGNRAYRDARFAEAVQRYDQARATGVDAPQLEYNRANALLKSGRLGPAIAGYERARHMGMEHPDLEASLRYARGLTRDPRPTETTSRLAQVAADVLDAVSPSLMFRIGWVCLLLAAALAVLRRAGGRGRATGWITGLILAGLVVQAVAAARQVQARSERDAVILGTEVPVRSGPGTDFPAPMVLHEGTVVRVGREAGPWREIELSSDVAGWVPAGALEEI